MRTTRLATKSGMNFANKQYHELADIVADIAEEVQRRNPIGVNLYTPYIRHAAHALAEISGGEIHNFTSEFGPREKGRI